MEPVWKLVPQLSPAEFWVFLFFQVWDNRAQKVNTNNRIYSEFWKRKKIERDKKFHFDPEVLIRNWNFYLIIIITLLFIIIIIITNFDLDKDFFPLKLEILTSLLKFCLEKNRPRNLKFDLNSHFDLEIEILTSQIRLTSKVILTLKVKCWPGRSDITSELIIWPQNWPQLDFYQFSFKKMHS